MHTFMARAIAVQSYHAKYKSEGNWKSRADDAVEMLIKACHAGYRVEKRNSTILLVYVWKACVVYAKPKYSLPAVMAVRTC